ncbi:hypothetical protein [Rhodocaloribacter sp.]
MIILFDNMSAALVGATVMLMLLSLQLKLSGMNLEQTSTYMVKNQASDLATWMEEDLLKLGENIDKTKEVPFTNPIDSAGVTIDYTFSRDSLDLSVTPPDTIRIDTRYRLNKTGTRIVDHEVIDVFRLVRSVRYDGGVWQNAGGSSSLIGFFKIEMLDRDAAPIADPVATATADPTAIHNTRIRFSMVTPFETETTAVRKVYYGSTLLIPN